METKLEPTQQLFEIKSRTSLYSSENVGEVKNFYEFMASCLREGCCGIVSQRNHNHDYDVEARVGLACQSYLVDVLTSVFLCRKIFEILAIHRHNFLYVSQYDCLGSLWEFAGFFGCKVWLNPRAKLGLPDIYQNIYPPGGWIEHHCMLQGIKSEVVLSNAVLTADEAARMRWIDLVAPVQSMEPTVEFYKAHMLAQRVHRADLPEFKIILEEAIKKARKMFRTNEAARKLFMIAKEEKKISLDRTLSQGDFRAQTQEKREIQEGLAYLTARQIVGQKYETWLTRRSIRYVAGDRLKPLPHSSSVVINISQGFFPFSCLQRLWDSNYKTIIYSDNAEKLGKFMTLVCRRLEQKKEQHARAMVGEYHLRWFCSETLSATDRLIIDAIGHDRIRLRWEGATYFFIRLSGNHIDARPGWVECASQNPVLNKDTSQVIQAVSNGTISAKTPFLLTIFVRSVFLEKLIWLYESHFDEDWFHFLKRLNGAGWGFLSDQSGWEDFLAARKDLQSKIDFSEFFPGESSKSLLLQSYEDLQRVTGKKKVRVPEDKWTTAKLTRALEVLCGYLCQRLLDLGYLSDALSADVILAQGAGTPVGSMSPAYVKQWMGPGRFVWACHQFWKL